MRIQVHFEVSLGQASACIDDRSVRPLHEECEPTNERDKIGTTQILIDMCEK